MLFGKQIEFNEYDIFLSLTLTYKWVFQKFGKWLVDRKCKFREWKLEPLSLGATSKDPTAFQFGQNKDGVEMQRYNLTKW